MIVTKSQFAELLGVATSTVRGWVRRKQLGPPALLGNGCVDLELGRQQLSARLDLAKSFGRAPGGLFGHVMKPDPEPAIGAVKPDSEDRNGGRLAGLRGDLLELELARKEFDEQLVAGKLIAVAKFNRDDGDRLSQLMQVVGAALPEWTNLARNAETEEAAVVRLRGRLDWISGTAPAEP